MRAFVAILLGWVLLAACTSTGPAVEVAVVPTQPPTTIAPAPTQEPLPSPSATVVPATVVPSATVPPTVAIPTLTPEAEPTATAAPTAPPTAISEPTATSEPAVTSEPQPAPTAESKEDLPPSNYAGEVLAIRTQNGLVLPVRGATASDYLVVTPCYNLASVSGGLAITGSIDLLIDPGHGGEETGAVGPNGLKESTVNLRVSELLRNEMISRGYRVELTRYSDQRVAIQARGELANALSPRVFMSIHHNGGYPEPFPVAGTEVFVQLDDPESARLGGLVFEEIQAAFAGIEANWMGNFETFGVAWRQNDEGTDLYGVLRRTPNLVSVLTEAMFISTEAEANLLARPDILQREAIALADALVRYFESEDPGSGFVDGVIFQGDLGNGGGTDDCVDPPLG